MEMLTSTFPPFPTDSVKQSGGRVLVHCQAGISRSATICLAYLMHTQRVRLNEAFDFVKQRRNVISPNLAFMGQLLQFETDILCQGWRLGLSENSLKRTYFKNALLCGFGEKHVLLASQDWILFYFF